MMVGQTYIVMLMIFALLYMLEGNTPLTQLILVLILVVPIPILILLRKRWAEVLNSVHARKGAPAHKVLQALERVLSNAGVEFTKVTRDEKRGFFSVQWKEVFDLDYGELRLHVMEIKWLTYVFLGPVREDNREEVERLKGLVEKALE
jgi:hypothetical protein